jgi:hypothetical protein
MFKTVRGIFDDAKHYCDARYGRRLPYTPPRKRLFNKLVLESMSDKHPSTALELWYFSREDLRREYEEARDLRRHLVRLELEQQRREYEEDREGRIPLTSLRFGAHENLRDPHQRYERNGYGFRGQGASAVAANSFLGNKTEIREGDLDDIGIPPDPPVSREDSKTPVKIEDEMPVKIEEETPIKIEDPLS